VIIQYRMFTVYCQRLYRELPRYRKTRHIIGIIIKHQEQQGGSSQEEYVKDRTEVSVRRTGTRSQNQDLAPR
jgi:hypothetical protein